MNIQCLFVDPQRDFCDPKIGSLYVKNAEHDVDRLALMVNRLKNKIDDIHISADNHRLFSVFHPPYWVDSNGHNPKPFTIISVADVENGTWTTTVPGLYKRALAYVKALAAGGKYQLCIWPIHCQILSEGANIMPNLLDAVHDWEKAPAIANFVAKGSNAHTENYSILRAEVEDPEDPSTQLNTALVKTLMEADLIAIGGEASSHCVASSLRDIANSFGDDSYVQKMVYLKDASSPVTGFEHLEKAFLDEMTKRGMKLSTTVDFLK